jgi:hypothetical protein
MLGSPETKIHTNKRPGAKFLQFRDQGYRVSKKSTASLAMQRKGEIQHE